MAYMSRARRFAIRLVRHIHLPRFLDGNPRPLSDLGLIDLVPGEREQVVGDFSVCLGFYRL